MIFSNPRALRFKSLFLSLLLLFAMVGIILSVNYYANLKVDRNSSILDGAGEMSDQFYKLALDLQQLNQVTPSQRKTLVEDTQATQAEINTLLSLLDKGGRYDYGDGDYIDISALKQPESRQALESVQALWQPYEAKINDVLNNEQVFQDGVQTKQQLLSLSNYAFENQPTIYDGIDEIYADRFEDTQYWNSLGKYVLIGGIALISLYFLWFVLYFIRRLIKSEEHLDKARQQNQEILSTINEGLFLIDKDLIIAEQYSDRLEDIVNQKHIAGKSLLDIISPLVSEQDLTVAKSFIQQLYSDWVVEELIDELNPLKSIKTLMVLENGQSVTRYLDFDFSRVIEDDEIVRILVTVADITQSTELSERLASEQQQNDRQIEMISNLIDVEGALLKDFVQSTQNRLHSINEVLKQTGSQQAQMQEKARHLYRQVHSIKGEASALKLLPFIDVTEEFESKISQVTQKDTIEGNDFLPLAVMLDDLMVLIDFVDSLANRLQLYKQTDDQAQDQTALAVPSSPATVTQTVTEDKLSQPLSQQTTEADGSADFEFNFDDTDFDDKDFDDKGFDDTDGDKHTQSKPQLKGAKSKTSNTDGDAVSSDAVSGDVIGSDAVSGNAALVNKWQRFCEDISKRHNKKVALQTQGFEQIVLDKQTSRLINDLIIQFLRNAVVHGIEIPKTRHELGKPEQGRIELNLTLLPSNQLQLVVEDDGRGIDFHQLKQKAIEAKLITNDDEVSKAKLISLMFAQGLSTADGVSEDAGRGVGMDIIKAMVEEQGGKLAVGTKAGQYTRFTVQIPYQQ